MHQSPKVINQSIIFGFPAILVAFMLHGFCLADDEVEPTAAERFEIRIGEQLALIRESQGIPLDLPHDQIERNGWDRISRTMNWFRDARAQWHDEESEERPLNWAYVHLVLDPNHESIDGPFDAWAAEVATELALLQPRYRLFLDSGRLDDHLAILEDRVFVPSATALTGEFEEESRWIGATYWSAQGLMIDRAILLLMDEPEQAARNFAAILHMNDLNRWHGRLIDQFVLGAIKWMCLPDLRFELLQGHLNPSARAAHLRAINALPGPPPARFWHQSVCNEMEIMFDWAVMQLEGPEADRKAAIAAIAELAGEDADAAVLELALQAIEEIIAIPDWHIEDLEKARTRAYRRFLEASHEERKIVMRIANPERLFDALDDRYGAVTVPTPSLRSFFTIDAHRIYRDLVHLMLAIEVYRDDHRVLPDSLEQLVPDYIAAVPSDPFAPDGRYRFTTEHAEASPLGYLLYSVGYDGVDNGGRPDPRDLASGSLRGIIALDRLGEGHDWVVSIAPKDIAAGSRFPFEKMPLQPLIEIRREHERQRDGGAR